MIRAGHVPGQHPLVVVRQHGHGGGGQRVLGDAQQPLRELGVDGRGDLVVGTEQLLALGEVAGLGGGGAAALHQQPRLDVRLAADQPGQVGPGLVVAHHGDEGDGGAERGQVAHHVAGAAGHRHVALDGQDGDRRLGRDAVDGAVDIAVEHGVADDEDAGAGKPANGARQVGRFGGACRARCWNHPKPLPNRIRIGKQNAGVCPGRRGCFPLACRWSGAALPYFYTKGSAMLDATTLGAARCTPAFRHRLAGATLMLAGLAGCTNPYDPGPARGGRRALLGAGTGAAIGALAGGGRGAAIGALAGGALGRRGWRGDHAAGAGWRVLCGAGTGLRAAARLLRGPAATVLRRPRLRLLTASKPPCRCLDPPIAFGHTAGAPHPAGAGAAVFNRDKRRPSPCATKASICSHRSRSPKVIRTRSRTG